MNKKRVRCAICNDLRFREQMFQEGGYFFDSPCFHHLNVYRLDHENVLLSNAIIALKREAVTTTEGLGR